MLSCLLELEVSPGFVFKIARYVTAAKRARQFRAVGVMSRWFVDVEAHSL